MDCIYERGSASITISDEELASGLTEALKKIGEKKRVLVIPPDASRNHSRAGVLVKAAYDFYGDNLAAIMPAVGTHKQMRKHEIESMFPGIPFELFREHNWKSDIVTIGEVPASFVNEVTNGLCNFSWPAQVNRLLVEGGFDLIISIGQVVPHEVMGMANYTKNIFVGVGGKEGINRSHWIGAACGIDNILGRINTPPRAVLDYAQEHFTSKIPILYALTVVGSDKTASNEVGITKEGTKGLFIGFDRIVFEKAANLSKEVNIIYLEKPANKVVVYLDPETFHSTWIGNKAIYRTRLAIAKGGELLILAPGVDTFGEDDDIDDTIRDYGYCGAENIRQLVDSGELAGDLAGAAHLAHGSSEDRFDIVYAAGKLSKKDVESVGYKYADCKESIAKYDPTKLSDGWNTVDGQEIYFIRNPALGLWVVKGQIL